MERKINKLADENKTVIQKNNKRKSIRILIKARKELRKEAKQVDARQRYQLVARMKMIDDQIRTENHNQFKTKIGKVVAKLRGKRGVNIGSMWEVMKRVKRLI